MDRFEKAVNSAKKHVAKDRAVRRGRICACGSPAIDKWRGEYICENCLNEPYEPQSAVDFAQAYTSSLARCQDWADAISSREWYKKRWWAKHGKKYNK